MAFLLFIYSSPGLSKGVNGVIYHVHFKRKMRNEGVDDESPFSQFFFSLHKKKRM